MRSPSLPVLAVLFTIVSAAVYPRQSDTVCSSYDCPEIAGYDVTFSAGVGAVTLCDYEAAFFPGVIVSTCAYSDTNGSLDESQTTEGLLDCRSDATCIPATRRRRTALPVAPPRAAAPQPLPNSLKMRGQFRKRKD